MSKTVTHTLKLKANVPAYIPFQREYSAAFRFAYERWSEGGLTEIQIRALTKANWSSNTPTQLADGRIDINSWILQNAMLSARQEFKAHQAQYQSGQRTQPIVWGTRKLRDNYLKGEATYTNWQKVRLRPIIIQGEARQHSNRSFDFGKLKDNILIYKPCAGCRMEYSFV